MNINSFSKLCETFFLLFFCAIIFCNCSQKNGSTFNSTLISSNSNDSTILKGEYIPSQVEIYKDVIYSLGPHSVNPSKNSEIYIHVIDSVILNGGFRKTIFKSPLLQFHISNNDELLFTETFSGKIKRLSRDGLGLYPYIEKGLATNFELLNSFIIMASLNGVFIYKDGKGGVHEFNSYKHKNSSGLGHCNITLTDSNVLIAGIQDTTTDAFLFPNKNKHSHI